MVICISKYNIFRNLYFSNLIFFNLKILCCSMLLQKTVKSYTLRFKLWEISNDLSSMDGSIKLIVSELKIHSRSNLYKIAPLPWPPLTNVLYNWRDIYLVLCSVWTMSLFQSRYRTLNTDTMDRDAQLPPNTN